MDIPPDSQAFEFSVEALMSSLGTNWQPFLLGCLVLGLISAALGYALARGVWRWIVVKKWSLRRQKNKS